MHLGDPLPTTGDKGLIKGGEIRGGYSIAGKIKKIIRMRNGDYRILVGVDALKRHQFSQGDGWIVLNGKGSYGELDDAVYDLSEV